MVYSFYCGMKLKCGWLFVTAAVVILGSAEFVRSSDTRSLLAVDTSWLSSRAKSIAATRNEEFEETNR
ncbi:hypothetical protein LPJGGPFB_05091 [Ensifer adhaerens]|uniref:hypothetical protein n=1 Tax=Ensifer adhaerens TaxID=106592 RepID=UPI0015698751|nr:hypothetical protein [Ensifer adhaerens]NRP21832.1 hypothetical protein [Ensifer adhaerens]